MVRIGRFFGLTALLVIVLALSGIVFADFGYGDVYWLNETTGQWVKDDGNGAQLGKTGNGNSFSGNTGGSATITGSATVAFEERNFSTFSGLRSLSTIAPTTSYTWVNDPENEIFGITAEALSFENPDLIDMVWDGNNGEFFLAHRNTVATWRFTYKVTNSSDVTMEKVEVSDNFNGELVIVESSAVVEGVTGSVVVFNDKRNPGQGGGSYSFKWSEFSLKPGESASLTFLVQTGVNPGGYQQYNECGTYFLHSGGVLKYKPAGQGQVSIGGGEDWRFKVRVCGDPPEDPPTICFEVSAEGVEWYVRKPGDYFTKLLDSTVRVTSETNQEIVVGVTFSEFGELISEDGQNVPVWYSFTGEQDWMTPNNLNRTELELKASAANEASFSMWQRIVLDSQSPGIYQNTGVITFTLVNSQTALCE